MEAIDVNNTVPNLYDDYAQWTDTVAKYPPAAEPFYLALGIIDEMGEMAVATQSETVKEAGDVLWYAARYSTRVLGLPFSELVASAVKREALDAHILHACGVIAGYEKKRIRDGNRWNPEIARLKADLARAALEKIVSYVQWTLHMEMSSIPAALALNRVKLSKRLDEGKIQGDGDNR